MTVPTFITLPYRLERASPPFGDSEIKYPESLVRYFLKRYTKPGDKIFDPFAGLGTTLFVAEEMGRVPYGIEQDTKRFEWVAGQLKNWTHLVHVDTADMLSYDFPKMDFAMTSPPFMPKHHQWNPLYGGNPAFAGYDVYLKRMGFIFGQLQQRLKRNAIFVLQADNLPGKTYTPLVRDLGAAAERHFRLDGEMIVVWDGGKPEYRHTHCLVFKNTA